MCRSRKIFIDNQSFTYINFYNYLSNMKSKILKELQKQMTEHKQQTTALGKYAPPVILSEKNTNELTKSIITYLNYMPKCFAYRVNNGAVYDPKLGRHRRSNTIRGIADIDCTYKGRSIKIEVKFGKDKLSEHQIKYKDRIEAAGGYFITAKNFDQFYNDFQKLVKSI